MKTLVAIDGSSYATTAMLAASRLLVHSGNRFELICVVPELHPRLSSTGRTSPTRLKQWRKQYYDYMERTAGQVLRNGREALQAEGVESRVLAKTGSPGDVLVDFGEGYDVVVVGAQSMAERPGPGLGPVGSRIVEHASGIALVGRELANENNFKILAAVDGSAVSRNALEALLTNFNVAGADVTLMHVIEKPWLQLELEEDWYDELERAYAEAPDEGEEEKLFGAELRQEAEQIIEDARKLLGSRVLSTDVRIVEGIPSNELLHEAEIGDYDCVLVGATGASDLKHTMLGSVAFKLAANAPCSVAVVR